MAEKRPISLCMIVKNEEKYLAACLDSVRDFVTDMHVVDTGSTDRTIEIAREKGAFVHHFEWINDFSAARNYAISKATQPWILQLDADEEILAETKQWFFNQKKIEQADAWQLEIRNLRRLDDSDVMSTHFLTRFFRNHPGINYHFEVHENILLPLDGKSGISEAVIIHKGYADTLRKEEKSARNFHLLKRALQKDPSNPFIHYYFAQQYYSVGDFQNAYRAANKALHMGDLGPVKAMAHRFILQWLVENGTLAKIDEAFKHAPDETTFPELLFYKALHQARTAGTAGAIVLVQKFLELARSFKPPAGFEPVLPDNIRNGYLLLADCLEKDNRLEDAEKALQKAILLAPKNWSFYSKRGSILIKLARISDAKSAFQSALSLALEHPPEDGHEKTIANLKTILSRISAFQQSNTA
jgi:glycosyltransferase involved in cell wall biosynthesis